MDNLHVDVLSRGREPLLTALSLFDWKQAVGYSIEKGRLIFYWHTTSKIVPFPFAMPREQMADFALQWLEQAADYGVEPDIDGDCKKGFRVYNEQWAHVGGDHYAFAAIEPAWCMYGK